MHCEARLREKSTHNSYCNPVERNNWTDPVTCLVLSVSLFFFFLSSDQVNWATDTKTTPYIEVYFDSSSLLESLYLFTHSRNFSIFYYYFSASTHFFFFFPLFTFSTGTLFFYPFSVYYFSLSSLYFAFICSTFFKLSSACEIEEASLLREGRARVR